MKVRMLTRNRELLICCTGLQNLRIKSYEVHDLFLGRILMVMKGFYTPHSTRNTSMFLPRWARLQ